MLKKRLAITLFTPLVSSISLATSIFSSPKSHLTLLGRLYCATASSNKRNTVLALLFVDAFK